MSVSVPALAGYDEVTQVAQASWRGDLVVVAVRWQTELWMRLDSAGTNVWEPLPVVEPVHLPAALTMGDLLLLAWSSPAGKVRFSRWDLLTREWNLAPTDLVSGESPSMTAYRTSKLALAYAADGKQQWLLSTDRGDSWFPGPPVPFVVDAGAGNVVEANISNPDPANGRILWAETDTP